MRNLESLKTVLGSAPAKVPLNAVIVEKIQGNGYEQIKIEYDVEQDDRISAYLLVPENIKTKNPAVYCHHQHASNFELGKSEVVGLAGDSDQAIGPELARLGHVVLAPDAIAFEERNWSFPTGSAEYLELANRIVKGETLLAKVIHDVTVGVDYLETLGFVDPKRIGFMGHSYGGRMAIWAPALEARIKASVSHCGCVNYKDSFRRDTGIQPEFCVPNILSFGDIEDVVKLVAPRALYISATSNDKYSRGAHEIYEYASGAFPPGQLKCRVWEGEHVLTKEMRNAAYAFLSENL